MIVDSIDDEPFMIVDSIDDEPFVAEVIMHRALMAAVVI